MELDFFSWLLSRPFYRTIAQKYAGKIAKRSGVSYTNHIREGAFILYAFYGEDLELIEAYCLHPLFQCNILIAGSID